MDSTASKTFGCYHQIQRNINTTVPTIFIFFTFLYFLTAAEVPPCYTGDSWRGVTLEEFAACPWNLANNRQTRMLADLALVGCYNGTLRHRTADTDRVLLASAKRNLVALSYFGLTEFQKVSLTNKLRVGNSVMAYF